jgi:hypothetical protein
MEEPGHFAPADFGVASPPAGEAQRYGVFGELLHSQRPVLAVYDRRRGLY